MKRIVSSALLLSMSASALAQDFSEALSTVEQATVVIRALNSDGSASLGTGFFVNMSGLLITNAHVIESASSAVVKLPNGSVTSVTSVKAIYSDEDVAFLQTGLTRSASVELESNDIVHRGAAVAVLGNPKGLEFSLSTGVVSGWREADKVKYLQFTAPISRGSSGSPVFNSKGKVWGMATMTHRGGQNLNFAVSSGTLAALMKRSDEKPQKEWDAYDPFRDARGPTQREMNSNAASSYEETDQLHQNIYDEIIKIYAGDKEAIEYLRRSQRAWIAFRDAHIRSIWPALETKSSPLGTVAGLCISNELQSMTQARIKQLLEWRKGSPEGNLCSGVRMTTENIQDREKELGIKKR